MSASVKIMLSYDYNHFEVCLSSDQDLSLDLVDDMRKDCQRLADKAVTQYKIANESAVRRSDGRYQLQNFIQACKIIENKPPEDRTIKEIGMLKQFTDEKYQEQFLYPYDYEDETPDWLDEIDKI